MFTRARIFITDLFNFKNVMHNTNILHTKFWVEGFHLPSQNFVVLTCTATKATICTRNHPRIFSRKPFRTAETVCNLCLQHGSNIKLLDLSHCENTNCLQTCCCSLPETSSCLAQMQHLLHVHLDTMVVLSLEPLNP